MRPSKFTETQMIQALRQVKDGTPAVQVCRALGITETTFYRWRKNYAVADAGESRRVRELQDENAELRQIVANLLLENQRASRDKR